MCDLVTVCKEDGSEIFCHNKREIRDALGVEPLIDQSYTISNWRDEECLCPCDIKSTALAAGMIAERDNFAEWVIKKDE